MEQFIIEDRYLTKKIRKSTFRVAKPEVNAFINNDGQYYKIDAMHHNSWALEEINSLNEEFLYHRKDYRTKVTKEKSRINRIKSLPEGQLPKESDLSFKYRYLFKSDLKDSAKLEKIVKDSLESAQEDLDMALEGSKRYDKDSPIEAFNKMHKNIGIDPAEYLVAECGYAAIENGYLIYGDSISYDWTDENDLIQDYDNETHTKFVRPRTNKEINAIKANLLSKMSYYNSSPSARFHCPSGFIRQDYGEFMRKCRRYGIDYSPRSSSRYFT